MTYAIEAKGLGKSFGETHAVKGVDLRVAKGTVYGLLGPNGAGKTTTIRMLATLLKPSNGQATVLGHDIVADAKEVRSKVSLTGQFASVDEDLTGKENLVLVGRLLGMPWKSARARSAELLAAFGLAEAADRQVRTYSGGMRRKLDIAASLVQRPELLFLDEPTTGLDPRSRNQVWDVVRAIAGQGTTVLLTTQYLEEADRLADRLAVIDQGRLIAEGTSRELKASVGARTLHVRVKDPATADEARATLEAALKVKVAAAKEGELTATVATDAKAASALTALARAGIAVDQFSLGSPSLDEVFFALTGRPTAEVPAPELEGKANGATKGKKAKAAVEAKA